MSGRGRTGGGGASGGPGVVSTYSAAQLAAMEGAGTLVPYTTYVASDTAARSFASNASTLTADPPGAAAGTTGTGTVSAPALVVSTGFSNAVAAAMEALSAALPKNAQYSTPTVAEQGVIELGNGTWTLEKTINLDLSGASVSRYGLTIRGQGRGSTILKTATTAPVANFRGGDGIWRMLSILNGSGSNNAHLRLEGFSLMSYATQGADGTTPLSDPARWLDVRSCLLASLRGLRVYQRSPTALSLDQYAVSLEACYYARLDDVYANHFTVTGSTKANAAGALKARKGGVGFRFADNNALVGTGLTALGCNLGFHLINEDGITLHGVSIEDTNKGFLFDGDASVCRVFGVRDEVNLTNLAMEAASEMYFARFGETTFNNYVEQFASSAIPGGACQDYSASKSNRVVVPREIKRRNTANLLAGESWTNGSGITTAAGADWPSHLDPAITSSTQITSTGGFNQVRYSAPVTVNPDLGSVRFRMLVQRVSGAGFLSPQLQSVGGATNIPLYRSRPQSPALAWNSYNALVPVASGTWAAGKLTIGTSREHGLQAGMRVRNSAAWGSLAINTEMYVESTPDPSTAVLIAAAAGAIPDPGAITFPVAISLSSEMASWSFCPDITADWQEFATNVAIRTIVASAPSLNGSDKVVIPFGVNLLGLQTGSKIRLSGFADARLNGLAYTAQAGDVSGSDLTLSAAAAMTGLVTTATSKGQTVTSYGYIGLTELVAEIRCVTLNTGQNIVWKVAGETLLPGYSDEM